MSAAAIATRLGQAGWYDDPAAARTHRGVRLSLPLEPPIATGRTAEVYAWKEGQVLKLFREWMPVSAAEYEARQARIVRATWPAAPDVGQVVQVNGRPGLEFERLDGASMLEVFRRKPWRLTAMARLLADLHVDMHSRTCSDLPDQHERLQHKIHHAAALSEFLRHAALLALRRLPMGEQLCHGDFHPDNVLLSGRGPVVIDWIDATSGNPQADVARTCLLLGGRSLPPGTPMPWLVQWLRGWFQQVYLRRYFQRCPGGSGQLSSWLPVVAAARLSEEIPEEEAWLVEFIRKQL